MGAMNNTESSSRQKCLVQKYGGTSVGSVERIQNIAKRTQRFSESHGPRIAIVVSAMSGETNRLLSLVRAVNPEVSAKFSDVALAAGEQVSVALTCAALEACGLDAEPFLAHQLGILTDEMFSRARILSINTERIEKAWSLGKIPVIAGFQGVTSDQAVTTIGRGGSDTSAVAIAVALGADFCEINTDVDGVYTADPRYVPEARLCPVLDFDVALEMASLGSKVLHPRCVELAAKYKLPLIVRNTFSPDDAERTTIMSVQESLESPIVSGVTMDRAVARFFVRFAPADVLPLADLFQKISEQGVNVDIIVYDQAGPESEHSVGFTVNKEDISSTKKALELIRLSSEGASASTELKLLSYDCEDGLAKISIVGLGMRSHLGVASRLFACFKFEGIGIRMISTSEIKVSCVVQDKDAERSYKKAHEAFFTA